MFHRSNKDYWNTHLYLHKAKNNTYCIEITEQIYSIRMWLDRINWRYYGLSQLRINFCSFFKRNSIHVIKLLLWWLRMAFCLLLDKFIFLTEI